MASADFNCKMKKGNLVYLMGASGVGKDSIIRETERHLPKEKFVFVRRFITRETGPDEDNIYIPLEEFDFLATNGAFIFFWQSNNYRYGISKKVLNDINDGKHVIINGSRRYYEKARKIYPSIEPVLITASHEARVQRLSLRGRESKDDIQARIECRYAIPENVYTIDNSGLLEKSVNTFKSFLLNFDILDC